MEKNRVTFDNVRSICIVDRKRKPDYNEASVSFARCYRERGLVHRGTS